MTPTPDSCEHWQNIVPHLRWFWTATEPLVWVMPCIGDRRVNYCPVCGAERRSCVRTSAPTEPTP